MEHSLFEDNEVKQAMITGGIIVGLIPTMSMLATSLIAFRHYEASSLFEMIAQYLCAGKGKSSEWN